MPQTRSYRKACAEKRVAVADGLTNSLANQAALDLCCAVHTISPVRIEPAKGGDYTIRWAGGGGEPVERSLRDFIRDTSATDVSGMEESVLSALKRRAAVSEGQNSGEFSFVGPGKPGCANTYSILVESFQTPAGEALALTVAANVEELLTEGILYRSPD